MEKKKPKAEYSSRTNSLLVYTKKYTFKVSEEKKARLRAIVWTFIAT